jgi:hypothetical protein
MLYVVKRLFISSRRSAFTNNSLCFGLLIALTRDVDGIGMLFTIVSGRKVSDRSRFFFNLKLRFVIFDLEMG